MKIDWNDAAAVDEARRSATSASWARLVGVRQDAPLEEMVRATTIIPAHLLAAMRDYIVAESELVLAQARLTDLMHAHLGNGAGQVSN